MNRGPGYAGTPGTGAGFTAGSILSHLVAAPLHPVELGVVVRLYYLLVLVDFVLDVHASDMISCQAGRITPGLVPAAERPNLLFLAMVWRLGSSVLYQTVGSCLSSRYWWPS